MTPSDIIVRESPFGKGLFTEIDIAEGTRFYHYTGKQIDFKTCAALEDECYPIQIGHDLYLDAESPGRYINHSCEPNCGLDKDLFLVALKRIPGGTELFLDYSTTILERHWEMVCHCGSQACRKLIVDFDMLPFETQKKYLTLGVVQPFIVEFLNQGGSFQK